VLPPCWAVNEKLHGFAPIAGAVWVRIWFIPGISERRRLKDREPLVVDAEESPTAAVSRVAPDKVLLEGEGGDDCTAVFPVMDAADETAARLRCCVLLVWVRDSEVAGCAIAVFVAILLTGICSDSDVAVVSVKTAEGATVAVLGGADFLMRL
jgi:hypothetical protein